MQRRRQLSCSFCGKKETEISKLVAGPKVYICNECVTLASRIMSDDSSGDALSPETESSVWHKLFGFMRRLVHGGDQRAKSVVVG